jgi:hypothetical protein
LQGFVIMIMGGCKDGENGRFEPGFRRCASFETAAAAAAVSQP